MGAVRGAQHAELEAGRRVAKDGRTRRRKCWCHLRCGASEISTSTYRRDEGAATQGRKWTGITNGALLSEEGINGKAVPRGKRAMAWR